MYESHKLQPRKAQQSIDLILERKNCLVKRRSDVVLRLTVTIKIPNFATATIFTMIPKAENLFK